MIALRRLAVLMATGVLAACTTVGPNYTAPEKSVFRAPAAQAPFLGAAPGLTSAEPLPDRWWHLYDDPVLDDLEQQALAANTDLRVAAANLARAHAVTIGADGASEPEFDASFAAERARFSGESFLLPETLPVANVGDAGIHVGYQIDLFGRLRRIAETAHASEEAVAAARDAVQVSVAADVARAYLGVCAAGEDIELAEQAIAVQERNLAVAERLARAGRGALPEVTQARARRDQLLAAVPVHRARRQAALYRLAYLLGKVPAEYPRAAESCARIPELSGPIPVGDGAQLLRRRPDIREAERALAAATARVGVATADLYPSISLGLSAGSTGFLKDLGTGPANRWSIGSLISWSIPGKGAHARVKAAGAEADAALARFDGSVLAALQETESGLVRYAQDLDRARALTSARIEAETAVAEAIRLRAAGRSPVQAELDVRHAVISARAAEQAAKADIAANQIDLFLALGGGWGVPKPPN